MSERSEPDKRGIKVQDAIDRYFEMHPQDAWLSDSVREEMVEQMMKLREKTPSREGGICFGSYALEVYVYGSEYYVDAAAFDYAMEQLERANRPR